jgi:hypothetical protein
MQSDSSNTSLFLQEAPAELTLRGVQADAQASKGEITRGENWIGGSVPMTQAARIVWNRLGGEAHRPR